MAKDKEDLNIPPIVPYFDPAGVYKAVINYEIVQHGRMEEQGSSGKMEYVPINPPVKCGGVENVHYDNLPVDGAQIVTIVMIKALQDVQVGGMAIRTDLFNDDSPNQAAAEAMLMSVQRPTFDEATLAKLKELFGSK